MLIRYVYCTNFSSLPGNVVRLGPEHYNEDLIALNAVKPSNPAQTRTGKTFTSTETRTASCRWDLPQEVDQLRWLPGLPGETVGAQGEVIRFVSYPGSLPLQGKPIEAKSPVK